MKAKKLTSLLLSSVMAMSMVACGGAADSTSTGETADSTATETEAMKGSVEGELTVSIWDENQRKGLQEIIDEWSAQSGVKATIQVVGWDDYWTLLEAGASGGELPDVFWMHSNQAQKYMENDMLMDLTDKIEASDKIDMGNYYEGINSGLVAVSELSANNEPQAQEAIDIATDLMKNGEWDVFSGTALSFSGDAGSVAATQTDKDLVASDGTVIAAAGEGSIDDGVIQGSMNYYVAGVTQVNSAEG